MSNPSPEPSAESLAEAQERLDAWERADDLDEEWDLERIFALALDAAKRSSRREALGQAAELVEERGRYRPPVRPGQKAMVVTQAIDPTITAAALRALMEAE